MGSASLSSPRPLPGWSVLLKNGWFPVDVGWRVHSAGIVRDVDYEPRYAIVVLMSGQPDFETGVVAIERIAASIYAALAVELGLAPTDAKPPSDDGGRGVLTKLVP